MAENGIWNFEEDDNINVFTYLSLLGTGVTVPILVFLIQILIPLLLAFGLQNVSGDQPRMDLYLPQTFQCRCYQLCLERTMKNTSLSFNEVLSSFIFHDFLLILIFQ